MQKVYWSIWALKSLGRRAQADMYSASCKWTLCSPIPQHLEEKLESKSAVEGVVNALNWVHNLARVQSPSNSHSPLVQTMAEGLRRLLVRPIQKKTPMLFDILSEIVKNAEPKLPLLNIQLATVCFWHSLDFCIMMSCSSLGHVISRL